MSITRSKSGGNKTRSMVAEVAGDGEMMVVPEEVVKHGQVLAVPEVMMIGCAVRKR